MIKVAFIGSVSKVWMGGLNYYKNLLYAISTIKNQEIEVYVFVGKKTDVSIKNMFKEYAIVIEDAMFDKKSFKWFIFKFEDRILKTNYLLSKLLKMYDIELLSHSGIFNINRVKTLNWIPDFQHLNLPSMFSNKELEFINKRYMDLISKSDAMVLSSFDALKDYKQFTKAPSHLNKVNVLQFVSQPDKDYFELDSVDEEKILKKYKLKNGFFYMPNQFWKHKNHFLVFEAVKLLVEEKKDICVVCTGHLEDYRNKDFVNELIKFIKTNKLENNIKLLGLVDYKDVFSLIKFSKAVINPSLFEGWSSTVEECKSVGKNMILSNLEVHIEQYPEAQFFRRDDVKSLKNVLDTYIEPDKNIVFDDLQTRTELFARNYISIVKKVING
jgi:glycosyltransferase involved in cell wall biosynthesis